MIPTDEERARAWKRIMQISDEVRALYSEEAELKLIVFAPTDPTDHNTTEIQRKEIHHVVTV
jgi:hypothetical protein